MKHSKAFTLIELLVVMSIISSLSSIMLASFAQVRDRARIASGLAFDTTNYHAFGAGDIIHFDFDTGSGNPVNGSAPGSIVLGGCAEGKAPPDGSCYEGYSDDVPSGFGHSFNIFSSRGGISYFLDAPVQLTGYTLSTWVKPTQAFALSTLFSTSCLQGYCTSNGGAAILLILDQPSATEYTQIKVNGSGAYANTHIPLNKWTHVAVTYTGTTASGGSNMYYIYVDGRQVSQMNGSDSLAFSGTIDYVGVANGNFIGFIDNAALYPERLTAYRIHEIYASSAAAHEQFVLR